MPKIYNWFGGRKPAWIYESLPFIYVGAGAFAILATGNLIGIFSGCLLIAAGITVNRLRSRNRGHNGKADSDAVVWKDVLLSGHPQIDLQHRMLIQKANTLTDAINHKKTEQAINSAIDELLSSMSEHFRTEEAILEDVTRAFINEHTKSHQLLSEKATDLVQGYRNNSVPAKEVVGFVKEMVAQHIEKGDSEFFFLTNR